MENWLQRNNVEIQGITVSENENVEEMDLKILKKLDTRVEKRTIKTRHFQRNTN